MMLLLEGKKVDSFQKVHVLREANEVVNIFSEKGAPIATLFHDLKTLKILSSFSI